VSRHKFEELLKNENIDDFKAVKDVFGNSVQDWIERGVFGYDKPLLTYFLQLDSVQGDLPDIWYGANSGEIKSPYIIIAIIEKIFKQDIKYDDQVIDLLAKERNDSYKDICGSDTLINELESWDSFCRINKNISNNYIKSGVFKDSSF